jgi:hypothetical protein
VAFLYGVAYPSRQEEKSALVGFNLAGYGQKVRWEALSWQFTAKKFAGEVQTSSLRQKSTLVRFKLAVWCEKVCWEALSYQFGRKKCAESHFIRISLAKNVILIDNFLIYFVYLQLVLFL